MKQSHRGFGMLLVAILVMGAGCQSQGATSETTGTSSTSTSTSSVNTTSDTNVLEAQTVGIASFSFGAPVVRVKKGGTVTFTNNDSMGHTATADDDSFDTKTLSPGQSKTITFQNVGTFPYHCEIHPTMKGTIIVE